jgi:hypothetical protein
MRFKLEGSLSGQWVDEVESALRGVHPAGLELDLAGLTFADAGGVTLLTALRARGAVLLNESAFVSTLLSAESRYATA